MVLFHLRVSEKWPLGLNTKSCTNVDTIPLAKKRQTNETGLDKNVGPLSLLFCFTSISAPFSEAQVQYLSLFLVSKLLSQTWRLSSTRRMFHLLPQTSRGISTRVHRRPLQNTPVFHPKAPVLCHLSEETLNRFWNLLIWILAYSSLTFLLFPSTVACSRVIWLNQGREVWSHANVLWPWSWHLMSLEVVWRLFGLHLYYQKFSSCDPILGGWLQSSGPLTSK